MRPDLDALIRHDVLPDGTRVLLRPLKPEDAELYPEFVAHIAPDDSRLRFFSAVKELSEQRIHELTDLDYERAMAFIAFDEAKCEMLGVWCGCISIRTGAVANSPRSCARRSRGTASARC
jgi:hypothetical protein